MRFTATVTHQPPWYVAQCVEVDVASQGTTAAVAVANLEEALELYFENVPLPEGVEPPLVARVEVAA